MLFGALRAIESKLRIADRSVSHRHPASTHIVWSIAVTVRKTPAARPQRLCILQAYKET